MRGPELVSLWKWFAYFQPGSERKQANHGVAQQAHLITFVLPQLTAFVLLYLCPAAGGIPSWYQRVC